MSRWKRSAGTQVANFYVFGIRHHEMTRDDGETRPVFTFDTPDWCNVVPITKHGYILLVRQHRIGIDAPSLEIPGGLVDPGETPIAAATRELSEETGYEAEEIVPLGAIHPNPALQANRLHMFLARGCTPHGRGQQLEDLEDCEVVLLDRAGLDRALAAGEISHALVHAALYAWIRSGKGAPLR
jgi:8-oxo-dGTP pyrophosphatase MutT (NUDIX family)